MLAVSAGCDSLIRSPGPATQEPTEYSSVRLPGVSMDAAHDAAVATMKEHFRLDPAVSTATVLISRPLESEGRADKEPAAVREIISGSSNRHRQVAQIRLVERGADVVARIHVQVQRLDVSERAAFQAPLTGDDRPANVSPQGYGGPRTLTDRDWVNTGRNRQLEQEMADSLAERLAGEVAGSPVATQPR
jgi:hypothetical protein